MYKLWNFFGSNTYNVHIAVNVHRLYTYYQRAQQMKHACIVLTVLLAEVLGVHIFCPLHTVSQKLKSIASNSPAKQLCFGKTNIWFRYLELQVVRKLKTFYTDCENSMFISQVKTFSTNWDNEIWDLILVMFKYRAELLHLESTLDSVRMGFLRISVLFGKCIN